MDTELDLDIDNYTLYDILALFGMRPDFDLADLKRAKRKALMSHPDKSGMDPKVFLFYSKAYRLVLGIYRSRGIDRDCAHTTQYNTQEIDRSNQISMEAVKEATKGKDFNKWFNQMWEQGKTDGGDSDARTGYGDWLASDEGMAGTSEEAAMKVRQATINAQVVRYQEPGTVEAALGTELVSDGSSFAGSTDAGLQYGDVREAYTETMLGVDEADYSKRERFRNVDDVMRRRKMDDNKYGGKNQDEVYNEMKRLETTNETQRAFQLARQDEIARENHKSNLAMLRRLTLGD